MRSCKTFSFAVVCLGLIGIRVLIEYTKTQMD
jgi:hypothetical protein